MCPYILLMLSLVNAYPQCIKSKEFLCGDACIDIDSVCQCGKDKIQGYSVTKQRTEFIQPEISISTSQESYCCGQNCQSGVCKNETKKMFSEKCGGKCFLDYKDMNKTELDYKSHYECETGECVPARNLCKGAALCQDRSDVRECGDQLKCVQRHEETDTEYIKTSFNGHFDCYKIDADNDGEFDNIHRRDEPIIKQDYGTSIDLKELRKWRVGI